MLLSSLLNSLIIVKLLFLSCWLYSALFIAALPVQSKAWWHYLHLMAHTPNSLCKGTGVHTTPAPPLVIPPPDPAGPSCRELSIPRHYQCYKEQTATSQSPYITALTPFIKVMPKKNDCGSITVRNSWESAVERPVVVEYFFPKKVLIATGLGVVILICSQF